MQSLMQPVSPPPAPKPGSGLGFLMALLFGVVLLVLAHTDILSWEGPILAPEREEKLRRELKELNDAEQYVLQAARDGYYPCFHCAEKTTIFLHKGEIWRYGVTRRGEKGRYGEAHVNLNLRYVTEFTGNWLECLEQEKLKIYYYGVHPENLRRPFQLIRPPGNKQDN